MKKILALAVVSVFVQSAFSAITLSNFSIDSSGAISGTITGTVSELGTTANNTLYIGQQGIEWVTTAAGANPFDPIISVGTGSTVGIQGSYSVGDNVSWFNDQDYFSIALDDTAIIGDVINFTFQNSISFSIAQNVDTSQLSAPVVRVGVGSVVPEPSTYAAIVGLLCLGIVLIRRRLRF